MKIRLWKLGSLEHNLVPTKEGIDKLRNILKEGIKNGGELEIVWGPEIHCELVEIEDDVKNYIVNEEGKLELIEPNDEVDSE